MSTVSELNEELKQWQQARRDLAAGKVISYSINNRSLTYMSIDDIQKMIGVLRQEIREAAGGTSGGFVEIKFK